MSAGWLDWMEAFPDPYTLPERPASDDMKAWNRAFGEHGAAAEQVAVPLQRHAPVLREIQIDGVPVLEIRPSGWRDDGRVTVYTHGGSQRAKVPRFAWATRVTLVRRRGSGPENQHVGRSAAQ